MLTYISFSFIPCFVCMSKSFVSNFWGAYHGRALLAGDHASRGALEAVSAPGDGWWGGTCQGKRPKTLRVELKNLKTGELSGAKG